jgi:enoyl-CoA hydratase/carnithine racemase
MSAQTQSIEPAFLREDRDGIATLTLNRPESYNLLTAELIDALQREFDAIEQDQRVRVIVLAAKGKGFSAGHDLKEIRALATQPRIEGLFRRCSRMMVSMTRLPQPVIARVQGAAAAAGCQLVAQCDLAVASDQAKFTAPGVTWGFLCSTPGVAIGRNLARKHAMEMLLTGEMIDARRALEWGLVNRVVPAAELDAAVVDLASQISAKPRSTIAAGKRAFYEQLEMGLERAYELAGHVIASSFAHEEGREGVNAFIEKRPPTWQKG